MAASAVERAINNLESSWRSLDNWLTFWIALVVLGLVIEVFVILKEHRDADKEYLRKSIRSPAKPSVWMLLFHLLGTGLIAIGVAGEFGIHIKAGKVETD